MPKGLIHGQNWPWILVNHKLPYCICTMELQSHQLAIIYICFLAHWPLLISKQNKISSSFIYHDFSDLMISHLLSKFCLYFLWLFWLKVTQTVLPSELSLLVRVWLKWSKAKDNFSQTHTRLNSDGRTVWVTLYILRKPKRCGITYHLKTSLKCLIVAIS